MIKLIKAKRLANSSTEILVTIGIGFTFLGIFLGFIDFDANDVQNSIPVLINGIKTAFSVSVFAIFSALILKIINLLFYQDKEQDDEMNKMLKNQEKIINLLEQINSK